MILIDSQISGSKTKVINEAYLNMLGRVHKCLTKLLLLLSSLAVCLSVVNFNLLLLLCKIEVLRDVRNSKGP